MRLRRSRRNIVETLEPRTLMAATDLDPSFSSDGVVTANFSGGFDNAHAVAVQKDGKIIVAGEAGSLGFAAVRFNADGTLDDGGPDDSTPGDHFGTGGKFTYAPADSTSVSANAIAVQKDGKIVIAGSAFNTGGFVQQHWEILRLNVDGSFDTTFGDDHDGKSGLSYSFYDTPLTGIALQNDGKIVVCGSANGDFLVGRFTATGQLDNDFDAGTVTTDFGGVDTAAGLAIDNLGNIVVAGTVQGSGALSHVGMARYLPNGTLDKTFGAAGKVVDSVSTARREVGGVAIRPNGHLVVSNSELSSSVDGNWIGLVNFYDDTGDIEAGGGGQGGGWKFNGIAIMPNGNFAFAASKLGATSNSFAYGIEPSGATPRSLGTNSLGTAVAVAPNGNVFIAGSEDTGGIRDFVLAKLVGVDPHSFGTITGNISNDADGDHVKDPNEKGMAHVRVYIDTNGDGQWDQIAPDEAIETFVSTDINGNYSIPNLAAGTYPLRQVPPQGYSQEIPTSLVVSTKVHLGKTTQNINFVNAPKASATTRTAINGSVFNDWNSNAKRDITKAVEPDLTNIVVFIDANKNGKLDAKETNAKTDAGGNYRLPLALRGTYRVAVVAPSGWVNTTAAFFDTKVATHAQAIKRFGLTFKDTNDTIGEALTAAPIELNLSLTKTVSAALGSAVDVNLYRVIVTSNQIVDFDVDRSHGSTLNSYLRLFDAKGTQLAANNDAAAGDETAGVDSYLRYKFRKAGTYYIAVSDHLNTAYSVVNGTGDIGSGTKGKYSLIIKVILP